MNVEIAVSQLQDGSLMPSTMGPGMAQVMYSKDPLGQQTAIIRFGGENHALATFDETGRVVVSYTLMNPFCTIAVVQSVENILRFITGQLIH